MAINFYSTTGFTAQEVMRIDSNGNIGIGSISPSSTMSQYREWEEILKLAETNPAVETALKRLRTTYYLSKDNGNKKET